MRKIILALFSILFMVSSLYSVLYTVGENQEFLTIQSAINHAVNGDSIIVHPGTYFENINFNEKSLFLGSLYSITQDTTYISQTVIDGQKQTTVITIINSDEATIEGFTIQNGFGSSGSIQNSTLGNAGGISIIDVNFINILFNVIRYNFAASAGGCGISRSNVYLKGNQIYKNIAANMGGGLIISKDANNPPFEIIFDTEHKNSIYYNRARYHNDIYINHCDAIDIYLKKGTFSYNTLWNYRVVPHPPHDYTYENINVFIEEAFVEEVNADLYVSPLGNDNNTGLSPSEALRTITMAIYKIQEDPEDIKTIHIKNGIYTKESGEMFPLKLKRYVKVIGESVTNTIIDLGFESGGITAGTTHNWRLNPLIPQYPEDITIENLTIKNSSNRFFYYNGDYSILIRGNSPNNNYTLRNILSENISSPNSSQGYIALPECISLNISNLTFKRNTIDPYYPYAPRALSIGGALNGTLDNISIDGGIFGIELFISQGHDDQPNHYTLSNIEIKNLHQISIQGVNHYSHNSAMRIGHTAQLGNSMSSSVTIINSTLCLNTGASGLINSLNIPIFMYNTILWGNTTTSSLVINNPNALIPSILSNNLFDSSQIYVPQNTIEQNNIFANPLFIAEDPFPTSLTIESPARNVGTLDIPNYTFPEFDLIGNPRIVNGQIDMGAYQYQEVNVLITADVTSGPAPLTVQFTNHSIGNIDSFEWDFDMDGVIDSNLPNPNYTYNEPGTYTVKLTVNVEGNSYSFVRNDYIYVQTVDNEDESLQPLRTVLKGNYPNPFNPETTINYSLSVASMLRIDIYNIKGQKVKSLLNEYKESGDHNITWNGKDNNGQEMGSGIYLYQMITDGFIATKKMILMK